MYRKRNRLVGENRRPDRGQGIDAVTPENQIGDRRRIARYGNRVLRPVAGEERDIVAVAAIQNVITGAAIERVVAVTAVQRVVAGAAAQRVMAAQADNSVVARQAVDRVVERVAGEAVSAVRGIANRVVVVENGRCGAQRIDRTVRCALQHQGGVFRVFGDEVVVDRGRQKLRRLARRKRHGADLLSKVGPARKAETDDSIVDGNADGGLCGEGNSKHRSRVSLIEGNRVGEDQRQYRRIRIHRNGNRLVEKAQFLDADQPVRAFPAGDRISYRNDTVRYRDLELSEVAGEYCDVMAAAAVQRIIVSAAHQHVITGAAIERIVAVMDSGEIGVLGSDQNIVAGAADVIARELVDIAVAELKLDLPRRRGAIPLQRRVIVVDQNDGSVGTSNDLSGRAVNFSKSHVAYVGHVCQNDRVDDR